MEVNVHITETSNGDTMNFKVIHSCFKKPFITLFLCFLIIPLGISAQNAHYNVKDFGATGQKEHLQTKSIQAAIDAAAANGGGTVYIPAGDYLSGTIHLRSNINLYLENGATIWGSRQESDYQMIPYNTIYDKIPVLIYASNVKNVSIKGKGRVHGQARRELREFKVPRNLDRYLDGDEISNAVEAGVEMKRYVKIPPYVTLVLFSESEQITLEDVTFEESNFWTVHLYRSKTIMIRGIQVYSDMVSGVNADGIGIDSSRDVIITDVRIKSGDDGIVLKTSYDRRGSLPVENVLVSNCIISSSSAGMKIGTESFADFRNIHFQNCIIDDSNRGLNIVIRDGALVENVTFTNITVNTERKDWFWWGNGEAIWLVVTKRNAGSRVGQIRDVAFENIRAVGQGTSRIQGYVSNTDRRDALPLENIRLRNVSFYMNPEGKIDKRATHLLQIREVTGLTIEDVVMDWNPEVVELEWSGAMHIAEASDVRLHRIRGRQGIVRSALPVFHLHNVTDALIEDVEGLSGAGLLLYFSGTETKNVQMERINRLGRAQRAFRVDAEIRRGEVR